MTVLDLRSSKLLSPSVLDLPRSKAARRRFWIYDRRKQVVVESRLASKGDCRREQVAVAGSSPSPSKAGRRRRVVAVFVAFWIYVTVDCAVDPAVCTSYTEVVVVAGIYFAGVIQRSWSCVCA